MKLHTAKLRKHTVLAPPQDAPLPTAEPLGELGSASYGSFPSGSGAPSLLRDGLVERWQFNALLQRQGPDVLNRMQQDDAVSAALEIALAGVLSRDWRFDVDDDDPKRKEIADQLDYLLRKRLQGGIAGLLRKLHTAKVWGFAPVEKVYRAETVQGKTLWTVGAVKLRPASTFTVTDDEQGNLRQVTQYTAHGRTIKIDPRRFIWHVHKPEWDEDFGLSCLVAAYPHWFGKRNLLNLWNVYVERVAGGFISLETIEGDAAKLKTAAGITAAQKQVLNDMVTNWQATMGAVLPPGWTAKVQVPGETGAFETREMSANKGIARALLQPNLLGFAEQGSYGSRGQAGSQFDAWTLILDMEAGQLATLINEQLVRELVAWNWGEDVEPPEFCFDPLTPDKRQAIATAWTTAVFQGSVRNTYEDELHTRALLGYPDREEDTPPAEEPPAPVTPPVDPNNPNARPTSNPLATAKRAANVAYAALPPWAQQLATTLYDGLGKDWEQAMTAGARVAWAAISDELRQALTPRTLRASDLYLPADLRTQLKAMVLDHLQRVAAKGQRDAAAELGHAVFALAPGDVEAWLEENADQLVTDLFDDNMIKVLGKVLTNGLASGADVGTIIAEAERALEPVLGERAADGDWDQVATPAQIATVVRTTLTNAYNHARRAFFEASEQRGYVQAYEFSAVLDDRTTDVCRECDGLTYPVDDPFWETHTPPLHFNCRSLLRPRTVRDTIVVSDPQDEDAAQPSPGFGT